MRPKRLQEDNFGAAVSLQADPKKMVITCNQFDVEVCPDHAKIISVLCKSAFSCKNVVKKGEKRQLFQTMFPSKPKERSPPPLGEQEVLLKIHQVKILVFDQAIEEDPTADDPVAPFSSYYQQMEDRVLCDELIPFR